MNFLLLLATLAALGCGPLIWAVARARPALLAFLDGFVLVSIAGLVLLEVIPGAFSAGGLPSAAFLLAGLLGPTLVEHLMTRARREAHIAALALAIGGLVIHSIADGAALAPADGNLALALAVALHSVPVGLMVWWLMMPVFGSRLPALALLAMGAATAAGYFSAATLEPALGSGGWAWFQALVAGSILHVVFGRPHLEADSSHRAAQPPYEGLGNLAAIAALVVFGAAHVGGHGHAGVLERLLALSLESAPALLLAFLIGGFVAGELPEGWLRWISRGGRLSQALRGMVAGLPLAICSCGVLPIYHSLARRGVPPAAGIAFLIATPEVGLTALLVSLPLLGLEYTLLRVVAAGVLAVTVALVIARVRPALRFVPVAADCCAHDHAPPAPASRLRRALRSGLVDLVDGTAPWILAGLVVAAVAQPYLAGIMWSQLPDTLEIAIFALLGMPLFVCAAGATPLVAVLIAAGVSPGAAIAFLLTGPAANLSTFGVLSQLHGPRLALTYACAAGIGAVGLGILVNTLPLSLPAPTAAAAHHDGSLVQWLSLAALLVLFAASLLRKGGRAFLSSLFENEAAHAHA